MGEGLMGAIYSFADHLADEEHKDSGANDEAAPPLPEAAIDRAVYFDVLVSVFCVLKCTGKSLMLVSQQVQIRHPHHPPSSEKGLLHGLLSRRRG